MHARVEGARSLPLIVAVARAAAAIEHARAVVELIAPSEQRMRAVALLAEAQALLEAARETARTEPARAIQQVDAARAVAWNARATANGVSR